MNNCPFDMEILEDILFPNNTLNEKEINVNDLNKNLEKEYNNQPFYELNEYENKSPSCACSGKPKSEIKNPLKKLFGENFPKLCRAISLYEFYLYIIFIFLATSTQNTYLALLFAGLLSKFVPETIIKKFL